ncbi:MAG: alpha-galactosidase [Geminicoccaceae bacterium]|nr:alpha-galactosidase [Geminicoccaceae bacterium]
MFPTPVTGPRARLAYRVALPLALILWLLPLLGVAVTSARPAGDLAAGNHFGVPSHLAFENYAAVFHDSPIGQYFLNSFKVTIPTVIGAVALSCLTGFAPAVYGFRLNLPVFFLFVVGNFVPFQILMVPVRNLTLNMGLYDTATGLVLFHVAFQTGFCTLFMRNFIKALPFELIESARVEGVSESRIFRFIVLPLMRPAIAALLVLIFTFVWNDYFWATVLAQGRHALPVTAGLYALNGQWVAAWQLVSAGSIVAALPPVAMFFLMQRHFIAGLTLGATKACPRRHRDRGRGVGLHFGWSGGHRMLVEELPNGRRQVQFGAVLAAGEVVLDPGGATAAPGDLIAAFGDRGRNGLANAFQAAFRRRVRFPAPGRPRPVHDNVWEAVCFDHRLDVLKDLADRAARMGAERFVLDDGWFGRRDDDTSGLGDWGVDRRKYPEGLSPLIDHVEACGMTFGLWVEPEMVSRDSDLARSHPDWIIMPDGLVPVTGRGQHVLDLAKPEVGDAIFDRLDALLAEYRIDYLKWDMNRDVVHDARPTARTLALCALLDRLRGAHPSVEIASCASGGPRIDAGILRRTHRVWLSDSDDAHERWRMQRTASQFLPPGIVGSHVGPRRSHTSGRVLPMAFRAAVAVTGHMGFEMDIRELTEEEGTMLARYTTFYKEHRAWMHAGTQHRLATHPDCAATVFVSQDGARFLAFAATTASPLNETVPPLRLAGLEPDARYRLRLLNADEVSPRATRHFPSPLLEPGGLAFSGQALMTAGIVLPFAFPDAMWLVEGQAP